MVNKFNKDIREVIHLDSESYSLSNENNFIKVSDRIFKSNYCNVRG